MRPANRQGGRSVGVATARRLQIALRPAVCASPRHPAPSSDRRAGSASPSLAPWVIRPLPPCAGYHGLRPRLMDFRLRGESTRGLIVRWAQRPTGHARESRAAASPGRLASRGFDRAGRAHCTSGNARSSSIGVIGSLLRVAQRNALARFAPSRRCSPSGVADQRVDPVDRPLLTSIMK
jgi:hypothetical protein